VSGLNVEALAGFQPPSIETDKIEVRSQNLATLAMDLGPIEGTEDFKKSRDLGDAIRAERTLIAQTFNPYLARMSCRLWQYLGSSNALSTSK
jgi:hypothetical protein